MNPVNKYKTLIIGSLGLVSMFAGCTELTHLGISGDRNAIRNDAPVARYYTKLSLGPDEQMLPSRRLGDIDGDGLDDLIIGVSRPSDQGPPGQVGDMTAYLFYGRAVLPAQLTFADADATFETGQLEGMSLGDVNGDGLADFVLGDGTGYEVVFGSKVRYTGAHSKFSAGSKWQYGGPPPEGGKVPLRFYRVLPVGDVNGDGADELVMQISVPDATSLNKVNFTEYLTAGRKGNWPSGAWEPSLAAASFGADSPSEDLLSLQYAGDIDGDGLADFIAKADVVGTQEARFWLFYGRPGGLHGTLTPSLADAELAVGDAYPSIVGDIDGDGADDLSVLSSGEAQFVYGSSVRYSGVVTLEPDLIFTGQNASNLNVGDFNADGLNDMIFSATPARSSWDDPPSSDPVMYELRGTGKRLTGRQVLQPGQLYQPVGYAAPDNLIRSLLYAYGDIDGDGSTDLAAFSLSDPENDIEGGVYLLPGSTPAPD
jgi:hypothetical protein